MTEEDYEKRADNLNEAWWDTVEKVSKKYPRILWYGDLGRHLKFYTELEEDIEE